MISLCPSQPVKDKKKHIYGLLSWYTQYGSTLNKDLGVMLWTYDFSKHFHSVFISTRQKSTLPEADVTWLNFCRIKFYLCHNNFLLSNYWWIILNTIKHKTYLYLYVNMTVSISRQLFILWAFLFNFTPSPLLVWQSKRNKTNMKQLAAISMSPPDRTIDKTAWVSRPLFALNKPMTMFKGWLRWLE